MKKLKRVLMLILCVCTFTLTLGLLKVNATESKTAIYTQSTSSASELVLSGDIPSDSTATFTGAGSGGVVMSGSPLRMELYGYKDYVITSIKLRMKSSALDEGVGSLVISIGSNDVDSIGEKPFSDDSWNGSYTSDWVYIERDIADVVIPENSTAIRIDLTVTSGKICCDQFQITYEQNKPKLDSITGFSLSGNTVSFNKVANATGYVVGLFLSEDGLTPDFSFEPSDLSSEVVSVDIYDVPQRGVELYIKVWAKGGDTYGDSPMYHAPDIFYNNQVSEYSIAEIKAKETHTSIYYKVSGYIKNVSIDDDPTFSSIDIVTNMSDTDYLTVTDVTDFDSEQFFVGEQVTLEGCYVNSRLVDTTVLSHTINYGQRFSSLDTAARLNVNYSYHETETEVWTKVTDAST